MLGELDWWTLGLMEFLIKNIRSKIVSTAFKRIKKNSKKLSRLALDCAHCATDKAANARPADRASLV